MRSKWIYTAAVAVLAVGMAAPPCFAVACGDVIAGPERLDADLTCATSPALTIAAGGSLDMDGFVITCSGANNGIELIGAGAKLSNGKITACATGVRLMGGGHKVAGVYVTNSTTGFSLETPGNKVSDCAAQANSSIGFAVYASGNSLSRAQARGNAAGIVVAGTAHKLSDLSISDSPGGTGLSITGDDNKVSKVRITNALDGLIVAGSNNKLAGVTVQKHSNRGIVIGGTSNELKQSVASATTAAPSGFVLGGTDNTMSGCRSLGSATGIQIEGNAQVVLGNHVFGSGVYGIRAVGSSAVVQGNLATGSGTTDLSDGDPTCLTGNTWSKNIGIRTQACVQ